MKRALAAACVAALGVAREARPQQQNSPVSSLSINGVAGTLNLSQGGIGTVLVQGGPMMPVILAGGVALPPGGGIPTVFGSLDVAPIQQILLDGLLSPIDFTNGAGQLMRSYELFWLAPVGSMAGFQAAVADPGST